MTDRTPESQSRFLARRLLEVLRRRQTDAPSPDRADLIAELAFALGSGDNPRPLPEIVQAIERSSLGEPQARAQRVTTETAVIVDVLARAARIAERELDIEDTVAAPVGIEDGVTADGPIEYWFSEVRRLLDGGHDQEEVRGKLEALGIFLTAGELTAELTSPPVSPNRELVRAVVEVLGGDWIGGGYEACYHAALHEQRRLDGRHRDGGRPDVSGITGADPLTPSVLLRQVQAPYTMRPPRVRGREQMIRDLVYLLDNPTVDTLVLTGDGGSGKSTVALEMAAAARDRDQHVWWVMAGDRNQVTRGMLGVATQLGAPVVELTAIQSNPEESAELLWRRMDSSPKRWLLVFDDVDDPEVLTIPGKPDSTLTWLRPSAAGTVLVTSRIQDGGRWGKTAKLIMVGDLPTEAGAEVILDQIRPAPVDLELETQARTLSDRMGGVPLALRTVGAYVGSSYGRESIGDLVDTLTDGGSVPSDPPGRLAAAWQFTMSGLAEDGFPHARTLLRLLATYAPQWVMPLDVLASEQLARCGLSTAGVAAGGDPVDVWRAALDSLCAVGLIQRRSTAGHQVAGIVLHPMVAEASRADDAVSDAEAIDQLEAAAVNLLLYATNDLDAGAPASWPMLRRLEPHVYALLDNLRTTRLEVRESALALANRVAEGLIRGGLFALGEELIRHARSRTTELGRHSPASLDAEHTLGWALGMRGNLVEAEDRLSALLIRLSELSGPDAPRTLAVRDHLAWVLAEQGRLDEAYRQFRDLLPVCERRLGTEHRATLAVRHRLAWITALRGRPDKAVKQFESLLPRRIRALGADHMEVFSTRYRLAWARSLQSSFEVAESEFVRLLDDLKRVLDDDSGPVIIVYARLSCIRTWLGRFIEAEGDYHHVLDARTRALGPSHPRTLRARHDLAWGQMRRGNLRDAERRFRDLLIEVERTPGLGSDHPLKLATRERLSRLLVDLGRLDEAERSARALLAIRERVSGPYHPATMFTRHTLALTLLERGRYAEAEGHLGALLDDQVRQLGFGHRHTLMTRATQIELAGRRGHLIEAHEGVLEVLARRSTVLGHFHPETLASREQLVWILGEMDRLGEAEDECNALIADQARMFGPMHPDTFSARYRLGWLLGLAGRGPEAALTYERLVREQLRVLGPEHPHTLRSRHGLAHELLRAEQYDKAEDELRGVLLERIQLLGKTHPDTLTNRHSLALVLAARGRHAEAERLMTAVLHHQEKALGPDHRHTLDTRERLYWIQERRGTLEDASWHWQQLLDERERLFGASHPDAVRARRRLETSGHEVPNLW